MRLPSNNRLAACLVALALGTSATNAKAMPPRLDTSDVDVEACPDVAALRSAIAAHLGRDPFTDPTAPVVDVRVRRSADGLAADVVVGSSSRELRGDACADLVRAAALTIALAIEREPRVEPPPPPPTPVAAPVPRDAAPPRDALLSRDRAVITASGVSAVGLLPTAAAGAGLAARVRVGTPWISVRGLFLPGASMVNGAFAMSLLAAGAGGCVEPFATRDVAAVGCAHVLFGSLATTDTTVQMLEGGSRLWTAGALSAGARTRVLGPISLEAAVEAHVPVTHPTFLADTCPKTGFQQPFAALALTIGAGVSIP